MSLVKVGRLARTYSSAPPVDSPRKVRILIADDHALARDGICALLRTHGDFEVAGEACNGLECVTKAIDLSPDVILMDTVMPVLDGIDATRLVRKATPGIKVLLMGHKENKGHFLSAIKAGAAGYLNRESLGSEMVTAIRAVSQGGSYLSGPAATALVETCRRQLKVDPLDLLTGRQREILKLVAEGHTNKNISRLINISLRTVEGHRLKLMKRLGKRNQTELVEYAVRKGLVPVSS